MQQLAGALRQQDVRLVTSLARLAQPENRCLLPANSFAGYAPEPNPEEERCGLVRA